MILHSLGRFPILLVVACQPAKRVTLHSHVTVFFFLWATFPVKKSREPLVKTNRNEARSSHDYPNQRQSISKAGICPFDILESAVFIPLCLLIPHPPLTPIPLPRARRDRFPGHILSAQASRLYPSH
ncbi:hypothetical protein BDV30DRAFT_109859 [Aspergillus minisclerotigenes]|uniref:Secreted protein n=1 Tax=Aspergillus minisclerotigenes TaxID=656917 RepID=A0A5N6J3K3_9EURO|nr:hypothetical protein BDV30DRAFT_109859 [Aspergillus minisclerotigenes]